MGKRAWEFFKSETVLCVAALCAVITMFLVPPDAAYMGYIDVRVLCLLLCLMAVVAGFQSCGVFEVLSQRLLSRFGGRGLGVALVLLPFFYLHGSHQRCGAHHLRALHAVGAGGAGL